MIPTQTKIGLELLTVYTDPEFHRSLIVIATKQQDSREHYPPHQVTFRALVVEEVLSQQDTDSDTVLYCKECWRFKLTR